MRTSTRSLAALFVIVPGFAYATACGGADAEAPSGSDAGANALDVLGAGGSVRADGTSDAGSGDANADAGPCGDRNPLKNPYFGDLHSHTSYSADAYTFETRNTPLDAYAFARGKSLQVAGAAPDGGGPITNIGRTLDFLAVTDHSEFLAVAYGCGEDLSGKPYDPTRAIYGTLACRAFRSQKQSVQLAGIFATLKSVCDAGKCDGVVTTAWQKEQQAAAAANDRCKFTSFVAYEWTHMIKDTTLHKNVVFGSTDVPPAPFDSQVYDTQTALWKALATGCSGDGGCEALTIPHNSNLSQGLAFEVPSDPGDVDRMQRYQRLVEIFQHKGGSECLSSADPDCQFEHMPDSEDATRDGPGYVREGLKKGLSVQATSGKNPLTMGIIGATDDHNGTPGNVSESTWPGHLGEIDDSPEKRLSGAGSQSGPNPGGLTVAWAEENTRESLFAAFQRRETYATSGPRMIVRFYRTTAAGDPCADPSFPKALVEGGAVPMGGAFPASSGASRFVVRAWKDEADLARIDLVKAWVDGASVLHEEVVKRDLTGAKTQGACEVFEENATSGPAFYYARVLQAKTPRWSSYDCDRDPSANPAGCADGGALRQPIQERAWTSPIWQLP